LKKFILLIPILLFSFNKYENELFSYILSKIFNKKIVYVLSKQKVNYPLINVYDCKKADIVLGNYNKCNKPHFVFSYKNLIHNKKAIGAFYWAKGRPQILLLKNRLKEFNLSIPKELDEYIY